MIVLAWILLISIPILLGLGIMTIVYGKKGHSSIGFPDCVVCGFLGCIGIFQMAHGIGLFGKMSLSRTGSVLVILLIGCTMLMAIVSLIGIIKNRFQHCKSIFYEAVPAALPLFFLGLFLVQSLFVFCRNPIIISGDITLETVQSFLVHDGIYRVMPLTGMQSDMGMPLRYTILCLPTVYAIVADKFNLDPQLVVCHIIPVLVLGVTYLAYFRLSESLFGKEKLKERYCFLVAVGLLLTFSAQVPFLDGYGALHAGYLGTSIRNLILVPYVISSMLERRYWKAILCILAEACIVWTFYGCGVCVALTLGMLILDVLARKVPGLGRLLKIFCKEEA